jgi:hypothetical protein
MDATTTVTTETIEVATPVDETQDERPVQEKGWLEMTREEQAQFLLGIYVK